MQVRKSPDFEVQNNCNNASTTFKHKILVFCDRRRDHTLYLK